VQGTSPSERNNARRYALILAAAHVAAAGLLVFLLTQVVGLTVLAHSSVTERLLVVGVAVLAGVVLDVRAMRKQSYSVGLERQTPKALAHTSSEWWVTPLLWGVDTGLIWTTYRVSFCSWLLLVLAAVGAAPPWAGLVYGLAFTVPLLVVLSRQPAAGDECEVNVPRRTRPQVAQAFGVASMVLLGGSLLWLPHVVG
jgi:hypothetical protein